MQPSDIKTMGSSMVLLLDGYSECVAHVWCKIRLFPKKSDFDVIKCLQQIEMPDLLHMGA